MYAFEKMEGLDSPFNVDQFIRDKEGQWYSPHRRQREDFDDPFDLYS